MMIDEISGRCGPRWSDCCGSAGHSAGRGADEMAAVALHHSGDMVYWDHGVPAIMVGGPDFFAFEPILQN